MTTIHAAAVMPSVGGDAEDTVMNNFYFHDTGGSAAAMAAVAAVVVEDFYTEVNAPSVVPVSAIIADTVSRVALVPKVRTWEVNEVTKAETFILDGPLALVAAAAATTQVAEAAIVVSFHGNLTGGNADRRRRGRVYIGPLTTGAGADAADGYFRPTQVVRDLLMRAAERLQVDAQAGGMDWVVLSKADPGGTSSSVITGGWIDDAFDTQRRRGPDATSRQAFTIP